MQSYKTQWIKYKQLGAPAQLGFNNIRKNELNRNQKQPDTIHETRESNKTKAKDTNTRLRNWC